MKKKSHFFLFVSFMFIIGVSSCARDDKSPVVVQPFKMLGDANGYKEPDCRHLLPSFATYFDLDAYKLSFKDDLIIDEVVQNPLNHNQWAYTIHDLPYSYHMHGGEVGRQTLHFIDLEKDEYRVIESDVDVNVLDLQFAGNHIVYTQIDSLYEAKLILYKVLENEKVELKGNSPVLSEDGMKMKVIISGKIEVLNLPDLEVEASWDRQDESVPYYEALWKGSEGFYEFISFNNQGQYVWRQAPDYVIEPVFAPNGTSGVLHTPQCWISENEFITKGGILVDIVNLQAKLAVDTCDSRFYENFTPYKSEGKIMAHRVAYTLNDTNKTAEREQYFHLLDINTNEKKKVVFDKFPR